MTHVDAVIVGAGFAGLACARALAERGRSVVVIDRKAAPGVGMHTTGILVHEAETAMPFREKHVRRISGIRLHAPSGRSLRLDSDDYVFLATDTPALMRHFSAVVAEAGADIRYGTRFVAAERAGEGFRIAGTGLTCDWLVGADGPRSRVAQDLGLGRNGKFLLGVEAEFDGVRPGEDDAFHCFVSRRLAPGYIGWVVPGVGVTQVGLAVRQPARPDIDAFISHVPASAGLDDARIVARRGGLIPVGGTVTPFARDRAILIGDAAGAVSPLTGGGIHTALHYGRIAGEAIADYGEPSAPHPAELLARILPGFRVKHGLRFVLENLAPDMAVDMAIANPLFRALARSVFYRRKRLRDGPRRDQHTR